MTAHDVIVGLVALQRLGELFYARANSRRLLARGGVEAGAGHYPLLVLLHGAWLIALAVAVPRDAPIDLGFLAVFLALQGGRLWVMKSLGRYWTTRIIIVPGAPVITSGPYRFVRHPNYWVVAGEIAVLPLVFGAWEIAALFSLANLVLLRHRIRVEDEALAQRRGE